ncbi:hypothetical protein [Actinopolyspora mortivallis]|nr:hypothetical protein [Actinopolyspora mortivallis]
MFLKPQLRATLHADRNLAPRSRDISLCPTDEPRGLRSSGP